MTYNGSTCTEKDFRRRKFFPLEKKYVFLELFNLEVRD